MGTGTSEKECRLPKLPKRPENFPDIYEFKLLTPMIGGGVYAGYIDQDQPVRASAIRGALRFWWRLLQFGANPSLEEMKKQEADIWGRAADHEEEKENGRSHVAVCVKKLHFPKAIEYFESKNKTIKGSPYVFFPLKEDGNRNWQLKATEYSDEPAFSVGITYSPNLTEEKKKQVEMSLTLWANFGGVGARTRRGCGSIFCDELAFENEDELASSLAGTGIQILYKKISGQDVKSDIDTEWRKLVENLKDFRQIKKDDHNKFSASLWPEARSIWDNEDNFPRAALGMPIIFHNLKRDGNRYNNDPKTNPTLAPCDTKQKAKSVIMRMASPVIMRMVKLKNNSLYAVVLILPGYAQELKKHTIRITQLREGEKDRDISPNKILHPHFSGKAKEKIGKYFKDDQGAVGAFKEYLNEKWKKEERVNEHE